MNIPQELLAEIARMDRVGQVTSVEVRSEFGQPDQWGGVPARRTVTFTYEISVKSLTPFPDPKPNS